MVMPDDKNIAWTNTLGMTAILSVLYAIAYILASFQPTLLEILVACFGLALVTLVAVNYSSRSIYENVSCRLWTNRAILGFTVALLGGLAIQVMFGTTRGADASALAKAAPYIGNTPQCLSAINQGHWVETRCDADASPKGAAKMAYCQTSKWVWEDITCPIAKHPTSKLRSIYAGKKVLFVGDSEIRNVYHQFVAILDPAYQINASALIKHGNIHYAADFDKGLTVDFVWAPMVANVTTTLHSVFQSGKGTWLLLV